MKPFSVHFGKHFHLMCRFLTEISLYGYKIDKEWNEEALWMMIGREGKTHLLNNTNCVAIHSHCGSDFKKAQYIVKDEKSYQKAIEGIMQGQ
jgi:hypothetical protein